MTEYHRLSAAQKEAFARDRVREPPTRCPECETSVPVDGLLAHLRRCPGPPTPHRLSRWVTWSEALELGVQKDSLSRWIRQGVVRSRNRARRREYLLRDVVRRYAYQLTRTSSGMRRRRAARRSERDPQLKLWGGL